MSKFDWKGDIEGSVKGVAGVGSIMFGLVEAGSHAGVSKPSFNLTAPNIAKLGAYGLAAKVIYDAVMTAYPPK